MKRKDLVGGGELRVGVLLDGEGEEPTGER